MSGASPKVKPIEQRPLGEWGQWLRPLPPISLPARGTERPALNPAGSATATGMNRQYLHASPNGGLTPSVKRNDVLNVFKPVQRGAARTLVPVTAEDFGTGIELQVVVKAGSIYIEWPSSEPMANVLATIHHYEREVKGHWKAVFDVSDDGLWEALAGGYRLHAINVNELMMD